ncbi:MAG: aldo/keto reductase [Acidobacteria bacterium]|nr:aldo/keto reductase [Acidobacteriota bacterium]
MQTRALGNSDLHLTPLGIGAWAIGGGGWKFGWGPQDDADSIAAIHAGLDAGLNWIDTAAIYGLGHSEEVVGRAVKSHGTKPYIFTKCERTWDEQGNIIPCLKADSIKRECEASLRRLGVDVIDLYQIHWPQPDEDVEEGWGAVAELQKEGKVRWMGVSNFSVDQLKRAHAIAPLTSLQPPYSILSPEIEDGQLPYVAEHNIGVLAYSPMKSGLLTGKMTAERIAQMPADDFRKNTPHFQEPKLSRNMALVELLRAMGARHGRSPGEVAIAWALRRPEVTAAIVGLRSKAQVDGVIGAAEFRLTADEVAEIATFMAAHPA